MTQVDINVLRMGRDAVFLVTGGVAHIGAAATAYCSADGSVRTETVVLPGHREGELAAELAEMAASSLDCAVAVLAGIHLDRPTRQDIDAVVAEARRAMRQLLHELHERREWKEERDSDADKTG